MFVKALFFLFILTLVLPDIQAKAKGLPLTQPLTPGLDSALNIHDMKKRKVHIYTPVCCSLTYKDRRQNIQNDPNLTTIYFVTPTYPRPEQVAELTRLSHTLMHVPRIHWILADDSFVCSNHVLNILKRSGLPYTHLLSPSPYHRMDRPFPPGVMSRGVSNRRAALNWIYRYVDEGILYFGDDDNTYDLELFSEIRKTKKLSMFPVGLIGLYSVSSPVIANGTVIGFFDSWLHNRKFPVDMAGFAVNIKHLKKSANMPYEAGMLEDNFLKSAGFDYPDIEPLADNCTKVLVWHTRTMKNKIIKLHADVDFIRSSKYKCLGMLLDDLTKMNVVQLDRTQGVNGFMIQNRKKIFHWGYAPKIVSHERPQNLPKNF